MRLPKIRTSTIQRIESLESVAEGDERSIRTGQKDVARAVSSLPPVLWAQSDLLAAGQPLHPWGKLRPGDIPRHPGADPQVRRGESRKRDKRMKCLNLGCGNRYHKTWTNVDFFADSDYVIAHNLLRGIPYPDSTFEVVYHSHVLEHFSRPHAVEFTKECWRVLKPGGIIRIAVPDLESIIHEYQKWLDLAQKGDKAAQANYDWIMLELYDQAVRNYGGGEMGKYLLQENVPNEVYVRERMGSFFDAIRQPQPTSNLKAILKQSPLFKTIRNALMNSNLLGLQSFRISKFRLSGEVHQWMYDRYSLSRLLSQCGFKNGKVCHADESGIPKWTDNNLDTEPDGSIYKPDSLYLEATK